MWQELWRLDYDIPFLFIRDFNAIYREDHRKNGSRVITYELYGMQHWMEDMELHPIIDQGRKYSWTNQEEGQKRTLTKIDHAIGNLHWIDKHGHAYVRMLMLNYRITLP